MLRHLECTIASGDALDVRHFHVAERMSSLFEVSITALCDNPDIDLEAVVGQPMSFTMRKGLGPLGSRTWTGLCNQLDQVRVEEAGASTYKLMLVPALWLLTQRRNHRMFQLKSEIDIVRQILGEWGIARTEKLSSAYKKRKYRVQYGESDYMFVCRMLEDAGISFYFEDDSGETKMVLSDAPQSNAQRAPIRYLDTPMGGSLEHVTKVQIGRRVRPGKYTVRDHDYRQPVSFNLVASASSGQSVEEQLERFHYAPGAFLFESDKGESTPTADDRGKYRTDEGEAKLIAQRRLAAKRAIARTVSFETNTIDPAPGGVLSLLDHPKSELSGGRTLLVIASVLSGTHDTEWAHSCQAVSAEEPYRPGLITRKPRALGVESATVVGPAGDEIHTDEFGRVRVHFHWDRESKMNETSSCWIHVSQPWGGTGFGGTNLPRIGQEVIVDFLGGDPDRPIIVGRVYTNLQKTPYKLPDNKTQSGWQSRSSPGGGGSNYNEIMFEDKTGQELVRMQAEKDLNKLVKHDEEVKIGNDRTKLVGHDDALTVGHDRTRQVGHDEVVSIGNDRTRLVGNNESVTIANSRSKTIGANETLFVGANQSENIGANRSVQVADNHSESIGGSMNKSVGGSLQETVAGAVMSIIGLAKAETVGLASAETVGLAKALTVGAAYAINVGASMTTNVGQSQAETVAMQKMVTVGEKIKISCGSSTITMDKEGNVVIQGTDVTVQSDGSVNVKAGGDVFVEAAANVNVQATQIHMN